MAGLRKAKKYDWKDSNMALFGSDTERNVKKESAQCEPAWEGAGQAPGLKIWRIVKFKVTDWPEEDYGSFYSGDSYIVLYTYKKNEDSEDLNYDLHFWIGQYSSQDEYGTAAYKTVELDTFLDDKAVQHREVQGYESERFRSYFKTIEIMEGGAETGFRHVEPREYKPRLLCFNKVKGNVLVKEVPLGKSSITSNDVFVYDKGLQIIQWNGSSCNGIEKFEAQQYCQALESKRGSAKATTVDESESGGSREVVFDQIPDEPEEPEEQDEKITDSGKRVLVRVSDSSGTLGMETVKEGEVTKDDLTSDDVFLVDTGLIVFVYVGANCSPTEKRNGFGYGQKYMQENDIKPYVQLKVVKEGCFVEDLENALV